MNSQRIHAMNAEGTQAVSPAGRFMIALSKGVRRACAVAPVPLGIIIMAMTIACFALKLAGNEAPLVALGVSLISGIALLVLTDHLPAMFEAIARRWAKQQATVCIAQSPSHNDSEAPAEYAA